MGAGTINPFFRVSRSTPMSHFVDESIPADLLLKAGLAKQGQQDKMRNIINTVGAFDQEALKGGDTAYIDATKEKINQFVDANMGIDLTSPQAQSEVFKFARGIQQDKKLKQINNNLAKVRQYYKDVEKLGSKAFTPAVQQSNRIINDYIASGMQGEDFGNLHVEEALNLHKKRQEYFNQMKANGGEEFTNQIKQLKGLYGKVGWKGISNNRIKAQAKSIANDYMLTPEGRQEVMLYEELKRNGNLPDPNMTATEFVGDRLLRTGMEFAFNQNTVSFNKGLNDAFNEEKEAAQVISDPGAAINAGETSYSDLQDIVNSKTATPQQKRNAQAILDRTKNLVAESPEGKAAQAQIDAQLDKLPKLTGDDFLKGALEVYPESTFMNPDGNTNMLSKEGYSAILKPALNKLSADLPRILKEELSVNKNTTLADNLEDGSIFRPAYDKEGRIIGIGIVGTDRKYSWNDLGVSPSDADALNFGYDDPFGPLNYETVKGFETLLDGASAKYITGGFFTSDEVDKIESAVNTWQDQLDNTAEGTSVQLQTTLRPVSKKEQDAITAQLVSANPNLFTAVGQNNEKITDKNLKDLLANAGANNISIRTSANGRYIEITRKIGEGASATQETFLIEEKGQRTQTFDSIFQSVTGEQNAGAKAGALGAIARNVTNTPMSLYDAVAEFKEALPQGLSTDLKISLEPSKKANYNIGDKDGTFTNADVLGNYNAMLSGYQKKYNVADDQLQQVKAAFSQQHKDMFKKMAKLQGGYSDDVIEKYYNFQFGGSTVDQLDQYDLENIQSILNDNYMALDYDDMINTAIFMSATM